MEHKRLSKLLILAGCIAVLGLLFLFFPYGLNAALIWVILRALPGIPYFLAMAEYFRICKRIGENRSFCPENAQSMRNVGRLLFIACGLWGLCFAGMLILNLTGAGELSMGFTSLYCIVCALAAMASGAVAIVALVLSRLLNRAARLQQESDLTI